MKTREHASKILKGTPQVYNFKSFNKDSTFFQNEKQNPIPDYFVYENDAFSIVATSM